jgi:hypothetical protein
MFRKLTSLIFASADSRYESAYSLEESLQRLRAATTKSHFGALARQAAIGKVTESLVSLQRSIPFVQNSFKPFFVGRFETSGNGVVLVGQFSMHWSTKAFMVFWFGFCVLWTVLATSAVLSKPSVDWFFPLAGVGMVTAGTVLVLLGKWFARNDVQWLSRVLNEALSAKSAV